MSWRAIVLAAGKGTRMKSARPKVLHDLCGRSMLWYVQRALHEAGVEDVLIVTNDELDALLAGNGARTVIQRQQLGTGHAVQIALAQLEADAEGRVLIAYGDMPLVSAATYRSAIDALDGAALAMITARMPLPSNFGRVVRDANGVERIVEARDATDAQLAIDEMNAGIYAYAEKELRESVAGLRNDNAQGEYYLTDTIEHLARGGKRVVPVPTADHRDVLGINDRLELALARKHLNARLCAQHMRDGVTIVDPDTTYLEPELRIGRDTVIYPNTSISLLSEIGEGCTIGPNVRLSNVKIGAETVVRESVIVDTEIGAGVTIGPFAHLRGGAKLADNVRIGNFVEVKNVEMAEGSKASHLSYLGDASIGEESNIGAGTITCNFDGRVKNRTTIGKNVMIGSNSSLVAPITIGDGALTGAGSVVTKDVPAGERVAGNPARPLPPKI
jgi:bifunctional UDP-N-acetylglucosamine pyrophosphorylase/glucosamine-1-phosphate N-acetyltransferase